MSVNAHVNRIRELADEYDLDFRVMSVSGAEGYLRVKVQANDDPTAAWEGYGPAEDVTFAGLAAAHKIVGEPFCGDCLGDRCESCCQPVAEADDPSAGAIGTGPTR